MHCLNKDDPHINKSSQNQIRRKITKKNDKSRMGLQENWSNLPNTARGSRIREQHQLIFLQIRSKKRRRNIIKIPRMIEKKWIAYKDIWDFQSRKYHLCREQTRKWWCSHSWWLIRAWFHCRVQRSLLSGLDQPLELDFLSLLKKEEFELF